MILNTFHGRNFIKILFLQLDVVFLISMIIFKTGSRSVSWNWKNNLHKISTEKLNKIC